MFLPMNTPFPNSYWLEDGHIVCGEYPKDFDDRDDLTGMSALLEAGVRVFVNLTEPDELEPYDQIAREAAKALGIDPAELEFYRQPIRDVSVPNSPEMMKQTLRMIRSARQRGKAVYIHCWGGKGRTGTVAGCLLSELNGKSGDGALDALGERWQACAKASYAESPETDEQRQYVRLWGEKMMPDRKAAIRSAILGAAVGDALGVPVEFQNRARRKEDPVTGMRKYGTHHQRAGTWSDDSSMIFATMEGLMKAGGYDPESVMREFEGWVQNAAHTPHGEVFDIGNATHSAIRKFSMGSPLSECGGIEEHSNGNGSLMRILPIGLAFADDRKLIEKASEISSLTHAHERSRFCCAFYCLVVSELLHGFDIEQSTFTAWEIMDRAWKFSELERSRFDALHPEKLLNRSEDEIGSSGHVIDTLEAALWVNAQHDSYGDAVLHSVNLGDDTDTTGCVAGGLAGLLYGEKGIPSEWLDVLVKRFEIESMCETFAEITWKV